MKRVVLIAGVTVVVMALAYFLLMRVHGSDDLRSTVRQQMTRLISEHQRLEQELSQEPFADGKKRPLEVYLSRIRRDGLPQHAEMRNRLMAIAEGNAELLALAEVYEQSAKSDAYATQLRALRTYVITWNEQWNNLFTTFMVGGNLAGVEPSFPAQFAEAIRAD